MEVFLVFLSGFSRNLLISLRVVEAENIDGFGEDGDDDGDEDVGDSEDDAGGGGYESANFQSNGSFVTLNLAL